MKYIKTYEKQEEYEIGDYVVGEYYLNTPKGLTKKYKILDKEYLDDYRGISSKINYFLTDPYGFKAWLNDRDLKRKMTKKKF
jgi:hypothetical protein